MADNFARHILGLLIMRHEMLRLELVDDNLFSPGAERTVFAAITKLAEDTAPETEININVLASECKEVPAAYISGLLDGVVKSSLTEETLRLYVNKQQFHLAELKLHKEISKADAEVMKMGDADFGPTREALSELLRIEAASSGPGSFGLDEVEEREIFWLWPGRIPLGMLTLLAGRPGEGKSYLTLALAARLSRGEPLPGSNGVSIACETFLLNAEDPLQQVVKARIRLLGADFEKVRFIDLKGDTDISALLGKVRHALRERPGIRLVVIDPLNAFLPARSNWLSDPDVRRLLLQPLTVLAEEHGVAVLAVCHVVKGEQHGSALAKVAGSLAYGAAARSVLVVGPDPDDATGQVRLCASAKANYSAPPEAVGYRIDSAGLHFEVNTRPGITGDDVLAQQQEDKSERNEADTFLREYLKDGPAPLKEILRAAREASIAESTLHRARKRLRISHTPPKGFPATTTWELPSNVKPS